jgi:F-type H+-transporting ATPase subunit delta
VIDAGVARRYARALLALGIEEGRHEELGAELQSVLALIAQNKEAGWILTNPGYSAELRRTAVDAVTSAIKASKVLGNFLRLLVDRQRFADLPAIARAYGALLDQKLGRVRATVTSAQPLAPDEVQKLRDAIAKMTGSTIVLEAKTDQQLLGGLVTQVGATQYDGSLKTQLERLRDDLKRSNA